MALDKDGKPKKIVSNGVPYYRAYRDGNIVVVPALGHLFTITSKKKGKRDYPVFDYQWVPRYQTERGSSRIRVWLKVIAQLAKRAQAIQRARLDKRTVGACLKCHNGKLLILRSKKTGKRFVGCTNYFEGKCNAAFPLPQTGTVIPLNIVCKSCGSPTVRVYSKGKRSWKLCLNPNCQSKVQSR